MSEIKFKVFNVDRKHLNPKAFNVYDIADECYLAHISGGDGPKSGEDILGFRVADTLIFLSYTGFKDSKGVEIYEKDILKSVEEFWISYEVFWGSIDGSWQALMFNTDGDKASVLPLSNVLRKYKDLTVCGNNIKDGKDEQI
jgi:hypothetical protein